MNLHTKEMMFGIVRGNVIKAEADFIKKIGELDNQKHLEFEEFRKKVAESVKDIPEEDFVSFATDCALFGIMSNKLNSLMIAEYVSGHENMSKVRKNELLSMAMVLSGMFSDEFDE